MNTTSSIATGLHFTDATFGVHQLRPEQHFSGHELAKLMDQASSKILPAWLTENNNQSERLVGQRYYIRGLRCFMDNSGQWWRYTSASGQSEGGGYICGLNCFDLAFWRTREDICQSLLVSAHLKSEEVVTSGINFISAEAEVWAHLTPQKDQEQSILQAIA